MVKISYTDVISTEVMMGTIVRVLPWVILITLPLIVPRWTGAQTPQQMEYERQQREYRQQQEQQRQEQQRQQQLMDENARRQQEESRRLNAPMGQSPTPSYQGGAPQVAPRRPGTSQMQRLRSQAQIGRRLGVTRKWDWLFTPLAPPSVGLATW
jgi:hypothetical protein